MVVSFIPVLNWPFSWIQTFFHEISHGFAALLTGGSVSHIELHLRGSGLCYTQGGFRFIVTLSGYLGASLFGMLLILTVSLTSHLQAKIIAISLACLTLGSLLLWARDLMTILILLVVAAVCLLPIKNNWHPKVVHSFLLFIGCYVLLDAIKSPLWLIDGRSYGDGATLADLTHLPEIIWVVAWEAFALFCVWIIWKTLKNVPQGDSV